MSKLLHLNGYEWKVSFLGEQALLLELQTKEEALKIIHQTNRLLEKTSVKGLADFIPAYQSITLVYNRSLDSLEQEVKVLESGMSSQQAGKVSFQTYEVPVCYEMGLDWEEVEAKTGLARQKVAEIHEAQEYEVAMMGFVPGFVYLSGLDEAIACPRKDNPRTDIPAGSVGIAGNQTGIYSLESPGGWQIIGRTPYSFFDVHQEPPTRFSPGDKVRFISITKEDFEKLEKEAAL